MCIVYSLRHYMQKKKKKSCIHQLYGDLDQKDERAEATEQKGIVIKRSHNLSINPGNSKAGPTSVVVHRTEQNVH